jgi:hypothetical protein
MKNKRPVSTAKICRPDGCYCCPLTKCPSNSSPAKSLHPTQRRDETVRKHEQELVAQ